MKRMALFAVLTGSMFLLAEGVGMAQFTQGMGQNQTHEQYARGGQQGPRGGGGKKQGPRDGTGQGKKKGNQTGPRDGTGPNPNCPNCPNR